MRWWLSTKPGWRPRGTKSGRCWMKPAAMPNRPKQAILAEAKKCGRGRAVAGAARDRNGHRRGLAVVGRAECSVGGRIGRQDCPAQLDVGRPHPVGRRSGREVYGHSQPELGPELESQSNRGRTRREKLSASHESASFLFLFRASSMSDSSHRSARRPAEATSPPAVPPLGADAGDGHIYAKALLAAAETAGNDGQDRGRGGSDRRLAGRSSQSSSRCWPPNCWATTKSRGSSTGCLPPATTRHWSIFCGSCRGGTGWGCCGRSSASSAGSTARYEEKFGFTSRRPPPCPRRAVEQLAKALRPLVGGRAAVGSHGRSRVDRRRRGTHRRHGLRWFGGPTARATRVANDQQERS